MTPPPTEIIHVYRHFYQHLLRAVHYSKPARYIARDRLRTAFRSSRPEEFDACKISRTLEFLDGAAKVRGLEHKVMKNLMQVWFERQRLPRSQVQKDNAPFRRVAFEHFDQTIEKLNESMGLCIK